jgi:hypothetical protein
LCWPKAGDRGVAEEEDVDGLEVVEAAGAGGVVEPLPKPVPGEAYYLGRTEIVLLAVVVMQPHPLTFGDKEASHAT